MHELFLMGAYALNRQIKVPVPVYASHYMQVVYSDGLHWLRKRCIERLSSKCSEVVERRCYYMQYLHEVVYYWVFCGSQFYANVRQSSSPVGIYGWHFINCRFACYLRKVAGVLSTRKLCTTCLLLEFSMLCLFDYCCSNICAVCQLTWSLSARKRVCTKCLLRVYFYTVWIRRTVGSDTAIDIVSFVILQVLSVSSTSNERDIASNNLLVLEHML